MDNIITRSLPGILLCSFIGIIAITLSGSINIPVMLIAVITGLFLNRLTAFRRLTQGINWCARDLLYIGVALMGLRIDIADLSQVGFLAPTLVILTLIATLFGGFYISRLFGQSKSFSILISGSVAICGVSAAAAISAALDEGKTRNQELAITVAGITALSTLVMITHPLIAHTAGFSDLGSALLMGGTIHNVSQAVGAGYAVSSASGDLTVLLKLIRISTLLPIVILVSVLWGKNAATPYPNLRTKIRANTPPFLVVFLILATLSCLQLVPSLAKSIGNEVAHIALVVSLVAIGIKTKLTDVLTIGAKPLIAMTITTIAMTLIILAAIFVIGA